MGRRIKGKLCGFCMRGEELTHSCHDLRVCHLVTLLVPDDFRKQFLAFDLLLKLGSGLTGPHNEDRPGILQTFRNFFVVAF